MKRKSYLLGEGLDNVVSSFFFRFYILIIVGFIGVGVGLDFILYHIQKENISEHNDSPWAQAFFNYSDQWMAEHSDLSIAQMSLELSQQFNFPISIIPLDSLQMESSSIAGSDSITPVHYGNGATAYLKKNLVQNVFVKLGPIRQAVDEERHWVNWVPILYYVIIICIVTLWFLPLRRDLNILSHSVNDFSVDYRKPLQVLKKASSIKGLANNIEKMADKIRSLIQGHKDLTGAISHELRTPMARIKFSLENLFEDNERLESDHLPLEEKHNLIEASREELLSIKEDVGELDQLIDAMLNYARFDHPDMSVDIQRHAIHQWITPLVSKFSLKQSKRLTTYLPDNTEQTMFDAYLLEIAVSNLLVNAFRYAESKVSLRCSLSDLGLVIDIEDDGEGIPESKRSRIFHAFTRLDISRNRETGGYGLGLAIVSRIATLHKGRVAVSDSVLGGAKFTLSIPMNI